MRKGLGLTCIAAAMATLATSSVLAETHASSSQTGTPSRMVALDDQDLKLVHGAGLNDDTLRQLRRGELGQTSDEQRRQAASSPNMAALLAALDAQTHVGPKSALMAVNAVNTAAQVGGTLIALTPITALAPIGLPLFGLPTLPGNDR